MNAESFSIRRAGVADVEPVVAWFRVLPPAYWATVLSERDLTAFVTYAVQSFYFELQLLFRSGDPQIAGSILFIIHPSRFWLGFALRRPLTVLWLLARFAVHRLAARQRARTTPVSAKGGMAPGTAAHPRKALPTFSWSPSRRDVARCVFTIIRKEYRGLGLSHALHRRMFTVLEEKGCRMIEAHLDIHSKASLQLHITTGWEIQELSDGSHKAIKYLGGAGPA